MKGMTKKKLNSMFVQNAKYRKEQPPYRFRIDFDKEFEAYFGTLKGQTAQLKGINKMGADFDMKGDIECAFVSGVFIHDSATYKSTYVSYSTLTSIKVL